MRPYHERLLRIVLCPSVGWSVCLISSFSDFLAWAARRSAWMLHSLHRSEMLSLSFTVLRDRLSSILQTWAKSYSLRPAPLLLEIKSGLAAQERNVAESLNMVYHFSFSRLTRSIISGSRGHRSMLPGVTEFRHAISHNWLTGGQTIVKHSENVTWPMIFHTPRTYFTLWNSKVKVMRATYRYPSIVLSDP